MSYCSRCGVEVENARATCPLCSTPIHHYENAVELSKLWPQQKSLPKKQIFFLQATMISPALILLIITFFILLAVDLRPDGHLNWSRYALAAVGSVAVGCMGILIVGRNRILTLGWITATILLMMKLFHGIGGGTWFYETAVPITVLSATVLLGSLISWVMFRKKFRIQVTIHALLIMLLCFGIDMIVGSGMQVLTWSVIVAIPLGVIAITGLFSQLILPRIIDFDKYFHS